MTHLWTRTIDDPEVGIVEQYVEDCDELGMFGWEKYDDGCTSSLVALSEVSPGFEPVETTAA